MSSLPGVSGADLSTDRGIAVTKKALDVTKEEGDAMVEMIRDTARAAGASGGRVGPDGVDVYA